ncbi:type II toxin-antitoxin system HipA family toxin [Hymenobacter armeniacus]|uniref:HipA domain-containing protein n=1 Tax=Hymenobacter armeniacus TaxID=2771358 RepID=A0ABR8JUV9_9BACT|nr:HipA domain-containing protein [Hymenobacter armeniacus]MBD2723741.1 HipA domain-containing protein [Hymenobacter armeniacus]
MTTCLGCYKKLPNNQLRFCGKCASLLFEGRTVAPQLAFLLSDLPQEYQTLLIEAIKRTSISGVQFKASMRLVGNVLELSKETGELEYILKPPPRSLDLRNAEAVPANEHLTMQLARQVFKLNVAPCALLRFADGAPSAYLTRRFDVTPLGRRHQEDFAQIGQFSRATHGPNYKYDAASYEYVGELIRRYVAAAPLALDEFFRVILFNYLVGNGDAHLKNFSLYRLIEREEYVLTPAYDLLNTALHVDGENGLAMPLFKDDYETPSFAANAYLAYDDFAEFGRRLGLPARRVQKLLADIVGHDTAIQALLDRSCLPVGLRERYAAVVASRRQRLEYSFSKESRP